MAYGIFYKNKTKTETTTKTNTKHKAQQTKQKITKTQDAVECQNYTLKERKRLVTVYIHMFLSEEQWQGCAWQAYDVFLCKLYPVQGERKYTM